MIKQYVKLAFQLLKQSKLLSLISLLGTAFAICLIMCMFLVYEAKTANYEPEVNRDRTLSVEGIIARGIENESYNDHWSMSVSVIKRCFYPLTTPECVTAVSNYFQELASSPGEVKQTKCISRYTDNNFWSVFQFRFLYGTPYSESDFESGVKKIVICSSLARKIFKTDNVVGRTLSINHRDYTICGVVADVSPLAQATYGNLWAPYTSRSDYEQSFADGITGPYTCYILAHTPKDFDKIRNEVNRNVEVMNSSQRKRKLVLNGAPDDIFMALSRNEDSDEPDMKKVYLSYVVIILIILLVPAINMSGIALSKMRQRMEEVGLRRTFGATRNVLMFQILTENMILTLMGGFLGLIFSYIALLVMRSWFFGGLMGSYYGVDVTLQTGMIIRSEIFLAAFLFCFLLNLLSAGIPAWRLSRVNIINALNS